MLITIGEKVVINLTNCLFSVINILAMINYFYCEFLSKAVYTSNDKNIITHENLI